MAGASSDPPARRAPRGFVPRAQVPKARGLFDELPALSELGGQEPKALQPNKTPSDVATFSDSTLQPISAPNLPRSQARPRDVALLPSGLAQPTAPLSDEADYFEEHRFRPNLKSALAAAEMMPELIEMGDDVDDELVLPLSREGPATRGRHRQDSASG